MRKIILSLLLFAGLSPFKVSAQSQDNIIDEVIWVVGDESILRSEVEQERLRRQYEGNQVQGDQYCVIPEELAIQKLFLHQAQIDSITVNETSVNNEVERRMNYYVSQIGSKEKVEEYFKQSAQQLREKMRDMIRDQQTIQQMQQKLVGDIKSTPSDVRRYFSTLPSDSVPVVPTQVELQIVSFEPPVSIEETNNVKSRLRDFSERVNKGTTEFSVLARLYSEDTESAKRGGELGFMGKGQLVPEFANVVFNMSDPKKVSRIVQTEFGYHIIQLIEKRGDRVNCRHILLKPKISTEERDKAVRALDSVANDVRNGKITFEQAVMMYSQDKNSAMNAGLMLNEKSATSKFEYQDLAPEVGKIVYSMNVGEISKPFTMISPASNKEVVAVVKLKSKVETHHANLSDDYQALKSIYEGKKKQEFLNTWIAKKQKETYISIDPKWQQCSFQYPGWIKK